MTSSVTAEIPRTPLRGAYLDPVSVPCRSVHSEKNKKKEKKKRTRKYTEQVSEGGSVRCLRRSEIDTRTMAADSRGTTSDAASLSPLLSNDCERAGGWSKVVEEG